MTDHNTSDEVQARMGIAALTACIAKALGESSPAFLQAFDKAMEDCYYQIREFDRPAPKAMEMLNWTREFLKDMR